MPSITQVNQSYTGPQITVDTMIANPTLIPRRILSLIGQGFLADQLLRRAQKAQSGAYVFEQSTPLYADDDAAVVAEGAEIPVTSTSTGTKVAVRTIKRALGMEITREMRDRNDVDAVNVRITQVTNTMVRSWDRVFLGAVTAGASTTAATAAWDTSSSKIRSDLAVAIRKVNTALDPQGALYGYVADSLVMNNGDITAFLFSDDLSKVFIGNIANLNPQFTGTDSNFTGKVGNLTNNLFGLSIYASPNLTSGTALVLARNTIGFIGDERPLEARPLYEIPQREVWRSDVVRSSAVGIDQPAAACTITGVWS